MPNEKEFLESNCKLPELKITTCALLNVPTACAQFDPESESYNYISDVLCFSEQSGNTT